MTLSAPNQIVFIVAVVLAVIALIMTLAPTVLAFIPITAFWTMTIAFVVLAAGCLFKGM
ncbi:MAG: hypothetical protein WEB63_03250 [Cucumibacter sp.]